MDVLLVEDDAVLADGIARNLTKHGIVVNVVSNGLDADDVLKRQSISAVVLDIGLPGIDGFEVVRRLRARGSTTPVLLLTARDAVEDRVFGLELGADDYLVKPFAMDEMLARIRAVRRRPAELENAEIRAGSVVFDLANEEVEVPGGRLDLPRRELRVLAVLMKRRGRTVLRETLEQAVFGFDDEVQSNTLDSHISRLRKKLANAGAGVEIHAIRGVGYLLREAA